jgi:hypothetical protein
MTGTDLCVNKCKQSRSCLDHLEVLFVVKFCLPIVLKQSAYNREAIDSELFLPVNNIIGMLQAVL